MKGGELRKEKGVESLVLVVMVWCTELFEEVSRIQWLCSRSTNAENHNDQKSIEIISAIGAAAPRYHGYLGAYYEPVRDS